MNYKIGYGPRTIKLLPKSCIEFLITVFKHFISCYVLVEKGIHSRYKGNNKIYNFNIPWVPSEITVSAQKDLWLVSVGMCVH